MSLDPRRRRVHDKLAALPGVRAVRRPVTPQSGHFDLHYVCTGSVRQPTLVVIPGGPGMASIGPYQALRRRTAAAGLNVIMVEHRGVGLSRRDDSGVDLPAAALTIEQAVDDIAAVLDDAGVGGATIYGTSYGSYLAAGMGVRHPRLVRAMVLDSPLLGADDIGFVRTALRRLLWDGQDLPTGDLAAKVRALTGRGVLSAADGHLAAALYGIGGAPLLRRHLDLLVDGRRMLWSAMDRVGWRIARRNVPYQSEVDLVGAIGFRELNFGGIPDGQPLDPAVAMRRCPAGDIPFEAEPFDLVAELPSFDWPTVVVSGGRDLTTPPDVARRVAALLPHPALVQLTTAGHSILDTREQAALRIAVRACLGEIGGLPALGSELDALPAVTAVRLLAPALGFATRLEAVLPRRRARAIS